MISGKNFKQFNLKNWFYRVIDIQIVIYLLKLVTLIPYWPLFNRPLKTKTTFQFLSKGPVKKRPVKVGPVKLKDS